MKSFGGLVLFLDRSDINTDEIIPAKYLTEIEKAALKPCLLEDLELQGFDRGSDAFNNARVIVTRKNFGCGSSREHAPWALEVNNIFVVIAENFARIFRQNMFNCGMVAIELPGADIDEILAFGQGATVNCAVNVDKGALTFAKADGTSLSKGFILSGFEEALVRVGGWVELADKKY